jgi:DNA helicase-2/ATP-dependent DNA helicase PcrA
VEYPAYIQELNERQRTAALHAGCPLLILAGAGSGKTRVITAKIAYLIGEMGMPPGAILAVTFTNKAAKEMAGRAAALDGRAERAMVRTFHSFGAWFLRRYTESSGLAPHFTIYDDDDSRSLVSAIMQGLGRTDKTEAKQYARDIALAKDYFYTPESPELGLINHTALFKKIYIEYEKTLERTGNVDFGDLIKKPVEILRSDAALAGHIRDRFRVILVDEYQDANVAQFELLKELFGKDTYLCVVGDDDQSIYRFRGAEVRNILQFQSQFENAEIIRLEQNYRSKQEILSLANSVIAHNTGRLGKTLTAERGAGRLPRLIHTDDQDGEAALCAGLIAQSAAEGARYSDWAVLYRMNAQSVGFESEFLRRNIPYRVIGSLKFYEREEIKDALSLFAFLLNPKNTVAFRRMVNKPARGLGKTTIEKIVMAAEEAGVGEYGDLEAAAARVKQSLSVKARAGLDVFLSAIQTARALLTRDDEDSICGADAPDECAPGRGGAADTGDGRRAKKARRLLKGREGLAYPAAVLLEKSGIAGYHHERDESSIDTRLSNVQELINNAVLFPRSLAGLSAFLDQIELDKSLDTAEDSAEADRVNLITLHNTKGLEFRRVIISACEEGIFPRSEKKGDELEEERRLFYVGATRAMDELYFTWASERRIFGRYTFQKVSRFLQNEADGDFLERSEAGRYGNFRRSAYGQDAFSRQRRYTVVQGGAAAVVQGRRAVSSDGRWTIGDRLFHDDEGYGEVHRIEETEDGPVIEAHFETGRVRRFLSAAQSASYMKILDE